MLVTTEGFDNPAGPLQPTVARRAQTERACSPLEDAEGVIVEGPMVTPFTDADPCVRRDPPIGSDEAARIVALEGVTDALDVVLGR